MWQVIQDTLDHADPQSIEKKKTLDKTLGGQTICPAFIENHVTK